MRPKQFALIAGLFMLVMGVLALIPGLYSAPVEGMPALNIENSHGLFLNFIPMNIVNKIALITLGLVGIAVSMAPATALPRSITWSRIIFYSMGLLAILGLFPQTNTLFGYWPLYSWNVAVYALLAIGGAYFGYALSSRVPNQPDVPSRTHVANAR